MKKFFLAFLLMSSLPAFAADITTLQAALEVARQNMETTKSQYMDAKTTLSYQEKKVQDLKTQLEKEQKQLEIDRSQANAARGTYYAAKEKHDRAQAILDKAWENH